MMFKAALLTAAIFISGSVAAPAAEGEAIQKRSMVHIKACDNYNLSGDCKDWYITDDRKNVVVSDDWARRLSSVQVWDGSCLFSNNKECNGWIITGHGGTLNFGDGFNDNIWCLSCWQ